jgi:carbon-monoxide dehydrogenase small subunit
MIMSAKSLLRENPSLDEEIKEAIAGNFCRCTGYARSSRRSSSTGQLGGRGDGHV